jgi:hypothetical protein
MEDNIIWKHIYCFWIMKNHLTGYSHILFKIAARNYIYKDEEELSLIQNDLFLHPLSVEDAHYRHHLLGFEVLTAVSTKMAVFCAVAPCSLVDVYRRFRGTCCLHH